MLFSNLSNTKMPTLPTLCILGKLDSNFQNINKRLAKNKQVSHGNILPWFLVVFNTISRTTKNVQKTQGMKIQNKTKNTLQRGTLLVCLPFIEMLTLAVCNLSVGKLKTQKSSVCYMILHAIV